MAPRLHSGGLTKSWETTPSLYIPNARRTDQSYTFTHALIQEPGDECKEVIEVFFKDSTHTAKHDPQPITVDSDLESSPSKMDKVSSAKMRKAAAEEATSATEGPRKEEAPIVKAKQEVSTSDAKEETLAAEAKKKPSSYPSFPTEEDDMKSHATSIQELGVEYSLEGFLMEHTASHIAPSTDKKLNDEQSPMMSVGIPSSTSDSTQENEDEALTIPESTRSFLFTIEESDLESGSSEKGVLLSTLEGGSSATNDAPEEEAPIVKANEDAPTVKVEEYDTSCPAVKSTKVKRYLHRGGRQLGYSSTVADDEIPVRSLKTTVANKKERQEKMAEKMAKAFKQGPAIISLKGHKGEKRGFKKSVKSTAEDPKEEAPIALAKETFPNVKVKEDDASCPAVKSTKIGRYLHQGGRGARSSTNVVDDDLLTKTLLMSLKSTASLASNYFSAIMSLTKKERNAERDKGRNAERDKGKEGKSSNARSGDHQP